MKRSPKVQSVRSQISTTSGADETRAEGKTLAVLTREAAKCRACDLWKNATQTIFGEGSSKASILFIGEQPGDQEDRQGHPFVGPAGKLLDEALEQAGIDRAQVYVTNAVKHFKWTTSERGKRRIHKKPRASEIKACRPWLEAEMRVVRPQVLVALGATAAQALFGASFSVTRQRGQVIQSGLAPVALATVHPSSILRAPDADSRHEQMRLFVNDLKRVASLVASTRAA
jgi:uracil-DNA glycosylase family protein